MLTMVADVVGAGAGIRDASQCEKCELVYAARGRDGDDDDEDEDAT